MEGFVTESMAWSAVQWLDQSVRNILAQKGSSREGPLSVAIVVLHPGLEKPVSVLVGVDLRDWPPVDSARALNIALQKAETAQRTGRPTSQVVYAHPEQFEPNDFFWPGGYAESPNSLAVGISGAHGEVDEGLAKAVFAIIQMECAMKRRSLAEAGNLMA